MASAIMGPSGSGKTTLLNVLAGQTKTSPKLNLSGLLDINGVPFSNKIYKFAYVRQEDLFFSQLTVRETLSLAAELQLQDVSSIEERDEYVNNLLFKTGLVSCADSRIGDAKFRGISGGEKKRLSLACELIASPSVVFADEPTTGLDAFQAERVMETLRQLAQDGHTVICSIHQPRGSVYAKFDDIVLLAGGSLIYAGPARDEVLAYFSKFGYICPDNVNPAEFLADLISIDYSSRESVYSSQKRINGLVESFSEKIPEVLYATSLVRDSSKTHVNFQKKSISRKGGWWRQFRLLLKRAWMQVLERLSFGGSRIGDTITAQSRILMFWYYTTYLLLEKNKPKYQRLERPPRLKDIEKEPEEEAKLQPVKDDDLPEPTQQVESPPSDEGKPDEQQESSPADPLDLFTLDGL